MSFSEYAEAEERGRRMAAAKIASDPEARKRVEAVYGETFCRSRYPESYGGNLRCERLFGLA
jgi:hypothetical protein